MAVLYKDGTVALRGSGIYRKIVPDQSHFAKKNQVPRLYDIVDISCSNAALFALNIIGEVLMLGQIEDSIKSNDSTDNFQENHDDIHLKPHLLTKDLDLTIIQIATGNNHLLALCDTGEIFVYGCNMFFQCGMVHQTSFNSFTQLPHLSGTLVISIYAGGNTSCVKNSTGSIYLWGDNRNSQCCINSSCRFIKQPTKIQSLENKSIKNVFIGTAHTIFSLNDNSYFACGSGFNGQLGSNIAGCTSYPTNFIEISNEEVLDIDVGSFHTIAASAKKFAIFGTISDLPCKNLVFKRSKTNDNQLVFLDLEKANNPMILYITSRGSKYALILAQNADQENMPAITESQMMLRSHKYEKVRPYILTNEILVNSADNDQSLLLCQKILTSPQNMSGSFWIKLLVNESACVSDNEVKELVSIVDMNLIRNSLKQLSGYTQHEYTLTHSFVILSQKLFHCKHIDSVICAIVVFEFPFLGNTKSPNIFMHFHMLKNLFKTIISYSAEKMEFLRQLLLNNDKKYFERAVKLCRIYIEKMLIEMHHRNNVGESNTSATSTLYNFSQNFQSAHIWRFVHSCIKVMEIFYGWNSTLSRNHSISIVNWQLSPELYKYVNLSRDFEKYFKNQRISNQSHDQQDFSYFRYPFLLNTEAKAMVINFDAVYEMQDYLRINNFSDFHSTNLIYQTISNSIEIDRENILETAIDNLQSKSEIDLKKPLIVKFRGEDGEDDGGVAREFFSLVSEEIFSDKNSFFIESENSNLFWFNSSASKRIFWTIGVIFGLAIHNSVIMHAPLPLVLFKKLLDRPLSCLEDLEELKPETYHGLKKILEYEDDDLEQIFGLNFSLDIEGDKDNNIGGSEKHDTSDDNSCQAQNIIELIPNGQNINVTKLNRDVYIEKIVDYYLNIAVEKNFLSFKSGFFKVLSKPLMSIFEPEQLQELLIGREIMDFDILRENCDYFEGYYAKHPIIERFWDVFYSLHYLDKLKFIKFLTGCERLPFDRKKFRMRIRCTRGGEQYLPVAHTCANMLDLPEYQSANLMKKKLLRSMYDSSGFTLV